ncbi:MAG: hypothetical protein SF052_14045 [Bacteroidia bacterium]|nr:hypothetical protein [Bacteroidia bacterium]
MKLKLVFFYCILQVSIGFFPLVSGQTLERRPFMGIQLGPVTEEIIHQHPELKQHFVAVSTDREGEPIRHLHADRLYTFQEQLANINLSEAWKKTDAAVLALWGKGDFVSNREDHRMIAEMVNFYHPGKGTFTEVDANHWFETAPDMETSFRTHEEGKNPELNPQVFTTILEWMKAVK